MRVDKAGDYFIWDSFEWCLCDEAPFEKRWWETLGISEEFFLERRNQKQSSYERSIHRFVGVYTLF